jgi:hypothetical protein
MMLAAPGADTSIGTVLPFSAISGVSKIISPGTTSAPPVNFDIVSLTSDAWAGTADTAATANPQLTPTTNSRLDKVMPKFPLLFVQC